MKTLKITIPNIDNNALAAKLELPVNQIPKHYAIFAHCFTCNKDLSAVRNISRALTNHGFGVLRFDFTGLGHSHGAFENTSFSSNIDDITKVNEYLGANYQLPDLIIGHSLGGAAALVAASKLHNIKAVATIGAPSDISHVINLFSNGIDELEEKGVAEVSIGGRPFRVKNEMVKDFKSHDLTKIVTALKKPLLMFHSPQDATVAVKHAANLYHAAKHPKSFISLDGADHLLSNPKDAIYVGDMIGSWANRYLVKDEHKKLELENMQVVAALDNTNKFTTQIGTKTHTFLADEPISFGGDNLGPSPYELLMAGLGACTVMTMKLYAERKQWDLQAANVYLSYAKVHADDINIDTPDTNRIDYIEKKIFLEGNLDSKQKKRLIEIAAKCPVHKTLLNKVVINTEELIQKTS